MRIENWRKAQKCFVAATFFLLCSMNVVGQEPVDSVIFNGFTNIYPLDTVYFSHSPAKAAIMSAVVPGLGQVYNRKYWKVPIVYVAIGISVERLITFQNQYNRFRRAYIDLKDNDPYTNFHKTLGIQAGQPIDQIITRAKEKSRTWRDYAIVAVVLTYALNIIDANVDAHLIDFSLDDHISLNIRPSFFENDLSIKKIGLTLRFTF